MPDDEPSAILRVLDANANRAREALRVMEDYARFVLSDRELSLAIKSFRHDLASALKPISADALLHRDTPSDVGTTNKTAQELSRSDLAEVVTAAGKRLGEALRTLEEFCKISAPAAAAKIEAIRYAGYDLEQRLGRTLRNSQRFGEVRLYVVLSESACRIDWLDAAKAAIAGGADCIQLREKTLEGGELLRRARALVAECHRSGVLCIINDRPDVAALSGADGVHVGQGDLPAVEARKIVGSRAIVGVSTHNVQQARQAVLDGADYIGIGPIFRSSTKPRDFVAGPGVAREVAAAVKIPVVAIAGITASNVDEVWSAGVSAIAVTAAVLDDDDVRAAAARLAERVRAAT
ncbi:MAG TPA: thiamine phosphate synthase [Tepidisphaeraceae bacterium]|nr:thiamine phosphate synthase [Tepidisphaeraceae bacterium]